MKRKIILIVEIVCVFAFLILFLLKNFSLLQFRWIFLAIPFIIMGIIRSYIIMIIGFHSLSGFYRWLKWKIIGKVTVKKRIKGKRGYTKAKSLKKINH